MKKHIPNLLTSLNLFSGCIACVMAFNGLYGWVVFWVVIAAVFDFFDGFFARVLNAPSPIGKELDSLADMVSFGTVPGIMVFSYLSENISSISPVEILNPYIPYFAFLLTVFSALRLAKFNIDTRQATTFIGLPTPANALFWISYIYGINKIENPAIFIILIFFLILLFSFLMVSEIPMFSLKTKKFFKWQGNELKYALVVFIILSVAFSGILGIALGMAFYITLSVSLYLISKNKNF